METHLGPCRATLPLVALLQAVVLAQGAAPAPDPWSGFPLGTWAVVSESRQLGESATRSRTRFEVIETRPGGEVTLEAAVVGEEDAPPPTQRLHVAGCVPADLGLELVSTRAETLTLGGQVRPCTVRTHAGSGAGRAGPVELSLELWECPGVQVPYRELVTRGPDLALGPTIVKAVWRLRQGGAHRTSTHEVIDLQAALTVEGQPLTCVLERRTLEESALAGVRTRLEGQVWLSDRVPGRLVRSRLEGEAGGQPYRGERQLVQHHLTREDEIAIEGVTHPLWASRAPGTWRLERQRLLQADGCREELRYEALVGHLDGRPVVERWSAGDGQRSRAFLGVPVLLEERLDPVGDSREETLQVGETALACQVREYLERTAPGRATTYTLWTSAAVDLPLRELRPGLLLGPHLVRLDLSSTSVVEQETEVVERSRRVLDLDHVVQLGEHTPSALLEEETERRRVGSLEERTVQRLLSSSSVPGHLVASCRMEGTGERARRLEQQLVTWGPSGSPPAEPPAASLPQVVEVSRRLVPHTWYGFPPGTRVQIEQELRQEGEETTRRLQRELLTSVDHLGRPSVLVLQAEASGDFLPVESRSASPALEPGAPAIHQVAAVPREVELPGRNVQGTLRTLEMALGGGSRISLRLWEQGELALPYRELEFLGQRFALGPGVARAQARLEESMGSVEVEHRVVELEASATVGTGTVPCVVEERTTRSSYGAARIRETARVWCSDAIPGGVARSEASGSSAGTPYEAQVEVSVQSPGGVGPGPTPWTGSPVGSWVRTVEVGRSGAAPATTRQAVDRIQDGTLLIRTTARWPDGREQWTLELDQPAHTPRELGFRRGEEEHGTLALAGHGSVAYRSETWTLTTPDRSSSTRVTLWVAENLELPVRYEELLHWRLRLEAPVVRLQVWHRTAQGEAYLDRRVEDPAARLAVAGSQHTCCLETVTSRARKQEETTYRVWTSPAVPGGLVRRERTLVRQGLPLTIIHQVQAYH